MKCSYSDSESQSKNRLFHDLSLNRLFCLILLLQKIGPFYLTFNLILGFVSLASVEALLLFYTSKIKQMNSASNLSLSLNSPPVKIPTTA